VLARLLCNFWTALGRVVCGVDWIGVRRRGPLFV